MTHWMIARTNCVEEDSVCADQAARLVHLRVLGLAFGKGTVEGRLERAREGIESRKSIELRKNIKFKEH
jgi:hypothetical protein